MTVELSMAEKLETTHVVLLYEGWRQSLARDLTTVATFLGLWSFGHFVGSPALEWVGALIGFSVMIGRAVAILKGRLDKRMTPAQARRWLDEKFPEEHRL